jgi:hypothetical protein
MHDYCSEPDLFLKIELQIDNSSSTFNLRRFIFVFEIQRIVSFFNKQYFIVLLKMIYVKEIA